MSVDAWNFGPVTKGSTNCLIGMAIGDFSMFLSMCVAAIRSSPALTDFVIVGDVFLKNVYTILDFGYPPQVHFADLVR